MCCAKWTFLLRSHWSKMKGLYIVTRYLPFIILAMDIYRGFTLNENADKCLVLDNAELGLNLVLVIFSKCISCSPILCPCSAPFSCINQTFIGASTGLTFATTTPATYPTSAIPGLTGCYQSSTTFRFFIPFLLFSMFDLGVLLSSRNPHAHTRHTQLADKPKLTHIMHAVFCSWWRTYSHHCSSIFQFMILATLAMRMHLHLWQMNQHPHSSSALVHIPMSDISFANPTTA
ncbi:uncharacterized protein F5147DRAFT_650112 [Suillus discolor]|uniref:Uncharacterized protein n=1 Tax=Suillus discolor TaxID=1912936 RepID=A0A9P7FDN7_9AGAM|nr:uncharacterized protein F5147DRAFT_650112 [Suillus discolor]KAG2114334.1 hypothetical protein F5147DRAFT_650112 [Suillus discolor]